MIPPAWTDVWIAPKANAHLQATGRDARGRKQYRYHPRWTAVRDETKYARMLAFARVLPAIRRRVAADLRRAPLSARARPRHRRARCSRRTLIRVGNDEYARTNGSFGLTTLRDRHVEVRGRRMRFHFRAKSGVMQQIDLERRRCWRAASSAARICPARRCSSTSTRTGARGRSSLDRRQRLPARGRPGRSSRPRTSAPGRGRVLAACALCADIELPSSRRRASASSSEAIEPGGRAARQHQGRLPQVLRPPAGASRRTSTARPSRRSSGRPAPPAGRHQLSAEEMAVVKLLTRADRRPRPRARGVSGSTPSPRGLGSAVAQVRQPLP